MYNKGGDNMHKKLKLVVIDKDYCNYLRKYDDKVPYNFDKKQKRPFIGILFSIGKIKYFAPLASPKPKHLKMMDTIDFLKIDGGNLGAVNFNNMIPVLTDNITEIDLNKDNIKYQKLLKSQLFWLNRHVDLIYMHSKFLYDSYYNKTAPTYIIKRCCNFKLLEEKCMEYNQVSV